MYKILFVEDDPQIAEIIQDYFSEKARDIYTLVWAKDGFRAEELLFEENFDLALLDVMVPGMNGFELCRAIRRNSDMPIIFLTARGNEADILHGYSLGGDDYMVKPFLVSELFAKVGAFIKRAHGTVNSPELICGKIRLNPAAYCAFAEDRELSLAPKEFALLRYLMEHERAVIPREQLLLAVWGYDFEGTDRVVDNHIKKLREKLGTAKSQIKTKVKRGYSIEES